MTDFLQQDITRSDQPVNGVVAKSIPHVS